MAAAALPQRPTAPDYVLLEEQQKRDSDEAPILVGPGGDTFQISIDSIDLTNNLAILRQNCERAAKLVLEQANRIRDFDNSLKSPPQLSRFYSCFCSRQHKRQKQERSNFIQQHLEQYASIHRGYVTALSPQLAAQIAEINAIVRARRFVRLTNVLDQTGITWRTKEDPRLTQLKTDLDEIHKKEFKPLVCALEPILKSIASIERLARSMLCKINSIHVQLNDLCETSNAIEIDKNREYIFVSFQSPKTFLSSKNFRHLHQALNELDDPAVEAPPESVEIAIPGSLGALLEQNFRSIKERVLPLQNQIFDLWIVIPAPED